MGWLPPALSSCSTAECRFVSCLSTFYSSKIILDASKIHQKFYNFTNLILKLHVSPQITLKNIDKKGNFSWPMKIMYSLSAHIYMYMVGLGKIEASHSNYCVRTAVEESGFWARSRYFLWLLCAHSNLLYAFS